MLAEVIGTCLLVFTVLSVATVPATKDNGYFGVAIGFAVVTAASTVGGVHVAARKSTSGPVVLKARLHAGREAPSTGPGHSRPQGE